MTSAIAEADAFRPGLQGVVAAQTRLSRVDGLAGELIIAGYPVETLAENASFEEVVFLLWNDRLPNEGELAALREALTERRGLPEIAVAILRDAAAGQRDPMDALRMAAGVIGLDGNAAACGRDDSLAAVAAFPTIVAAYPRLRARQEPIAPRTDLGQAANFLYMLTGNEPLPEQSRSLEAYWNTVVDHGLNASTFTARVIVSTQSDILSAVVGAVGALKGPLHGGAPGPALDMVFAIGAPERAEAYIRAKLERGERLMGFGHRVYKVRDPRADVLADVAERLYRTAGDQALYQLAGHVEETALRLLDEYKPGRRLETNVEFYTALVLHGIGLSADLFTPVFACARVAGWTAHCLEQQESARIIRPESAYVGAVGRAWMSMADR